MYCLANMCYVCLKKKNTPISNTNSSLSVNKDIIHIIGYLPFNLAWLKTNQIILICEECCLRLRQTYQFQEMCLKNSALLQGYKDKLKSTSISKTENEAELTVMLDLNNKHKDMNEVKSEIKLEKEEMYRDEWGPIIEETEAVYVNFENFFVKEEVTWKREDADDKEEHPMDNSSTACINNELNSEISVHTNAHDTDTVSSAFTWKQVRATNKKKLNAAAKNSYTCSTCSKFFNKKINFETHTRVHTGEKPFKCSRCVKCFRQQSHLREHMLVHTGEKPFECTECGKCFRRKHHLTNHVPVHTGEKPFKCSICEKCFGRTASLAIHMRVHTGKKPYECSICKKCFGLKLNLVSHMRTHTVT